MQRKPLMAGNWKMNLHAQKAAALAQQIEAVAAEVGDRVEVAVFPPACYLTHVIAAAGGEARHLRVGAQNIHSDRAGAYTGEIAANMVRDLGATHVLCGHSERRQLFGETPTFVGTKVAAAHRDGLVPVLCVGETLEEREGGETETIVREQLEAGLVALINAQIVETVIAYEPVWAIGTGRTATPAQAQAVHAFIRSYLEEHYGAEVAVQVRILYGGSVKADNAAEILAQPDVDGVLVGGASLDAASFATIVRSAQG
jgi:triosephosphate isomerase